MSEAAEPGQTWASLALISVTVLSGVGSERADALSALGISSVADLLMHYPRRYIDRTRQPGIDQLLVGEQATVMVNVVSVQSRRIRSGRTMVELDCADDSGRLHVSFFNQPWRARQLKEKSDVVLSGKVETFRGRAQMTNPLVDLVGTKTGKIVPVYPASERASIASWEIAALTEQAVKLAGTFADPLPKSWRKRLEMVDRTVAVAATHVPSSVEAYRAGRRRLAFDELLRLQVALVGRKVASEQNSAGFAHSALAQRNGLVKSFLDCLPFSLTPAQQIALEEIERDMLASIPMHRLLQGDVGAGKTVVAAGAMAVAVQAGNQAALMAPTEVLAEQHHASLSSFYESLSVPDPQRLDGKRPLKLGLLTSHVPARERAKLLAQASGGEVDIIVGTHALLTADVTFSSLGLVVVDEQHRFGVEQRALLRQKRSLHRGEQPDLLVMTATPIPRTAAMTVFGDLDVTVVGELPGGRAKTTTLWARKQDEVEQAWETARREVGKGRRAYVVCPLVEGSDRIQARSAVEEFERLSREELRGLRLGLMHGQMLPGEKQKAMSDFRSGKVQVLVATTVIEVGVDVADATVMIVQDAEHFGMAQLHQLRGRVGRAQWQSWCYLLSSTEAPEATQKLQALESSTDGFWLAEKDLQLRGEGTMLGTRQQGRSDLRLASVVRHAELVATARQVAKDMIGSDASLKGHSVLAEEVAHLISDEADFLLKS